MKYEFDIKEIIFELFSEREETGKERAMWVKYGEHFDKFYESLPQQQQETLTKLDQERDKIESEKEEVLIGFIVDFFRDLKL